MLALKVFLLFAAGFSNIIIALAVLLRDVKKLSNISYFGFAVSMAGWTIGIAAFLLSNSHTAAFAWAKIYYFFPLIIAVFLVLFVRLFPNYSTISRKWFIGVILGFLALAIPLIVFKGFVTQSLIYHSWGKQILLNKADYLFYAAYLLICYPMALYIMFTKRKTERGIYARQADLFFKGFLITYIFGVFFNLILPWVGNYRLIWLGPLFTNFFLLAIAYSIVRHRMFDVRLIIARSLAYVFALGILIVTYGLISLFIIDRIFKTTSGNFTQNAVSIVLVVFIALTYGPVKQFFNKATNRIFYRDAYDPQQFIDQLNRALVKTAELTTLLENTATLMEVNLKMSYCLFNIRKTLTMPERTIGHRGLIRSHNFAFMSNVIPLLHQKILVTDYLEAGDEELRIILQKNDVAIIARLMSTGKQGIEGNGYLVMGPKKSGNPYSSNDIKILEIIVNELVIAIQNALRFEEIENFNATLQQRVDETTLKLRQTNEKLKALDETKDEFISMASHQLRTPLTSVKGYVSMVLDGDAGKLNSMQTKLLNQAFTSSQRMVYLIADLLNVSRLKTGKFVIETQPTNLATVVEGELSQLQEMAKARGLELIYNKPENFPILTLDETKTRQVIMNFIDNAIYYTPSGGHIKIELEDKAQTIEYRVIDDGLGVPKPEQHHLFSKFYRAANARKARPDGTGLGLFMAKKVIIAQGGAIIFKSQEGKGSTFGFSFSKNKLQVSPSTK